MVPLHWCLREEHKGKTKEYGEHVGSLIPSRFWQSCVGMNSPAEYH